MKLEALRKMVWQAHLELEKQGVGFSAWGSVSGIDRDRGLVVTKPQGIPQGELRPERMVVVDLEGKIVEGELNPSSDTPIHLELYRHFLSVGGIAHTHSSWACVWAQAGQGIPCYGVAHADCFRGTIPCTPMFTEEEVRGDYEQSTAQVIVECFRFLDYREIPGVLVAGHGPFTWGENPQEAVYHSVILEEVAKTTFFTLLFHPERPPLPHFLLDRHFFGTHVPRSYRQKEDSFLPYLTVITVANRVEAELLRGHLEAQGIQVVLKPSTFPYGGEAYFGDTGPFEVQVREDQVPEARRVIDDLGIQ